MMIKELYYRYGSLAALTQKYLQFGKNIYSEDWDICIVLDSTRVDMLREHFDSEGDIRSVWSLGSITTEWLSNTFNLSYASEISETVFVSATPHSSTVFRDGHWLTNQEDTDVWYPENHCVNHSDFDGFYEPWRSQNPVRPPMMMDATLEAHQKHEKVVAHWLQPHEPFIHPSCDYRGGEASEKSVWSELQNREIDEQTVWENYNLNLQYALKYVKMLLRQVDAKVLITSDHGNCFGEWGIYGHPFAFPQPEVRKVPWVIVEAEKEEDYGVDGVLQQNGDISREEQLEALGYR